ncbi:MAG: flagellar biosynthesis protein FlgN [Mangrovicoccus sp.]|nr:flagellar biosynthesis protein FlgN [Mangrovicoccus sp.]
MAGSDDGTGRLATLLAEERRCLIAADIDGLADLAAEKQALAEALALRPVPAGGDAARLAALARRNQALLEAAADGLRAALRRVTEVRNLHRGRGTYDASGLRADSADSAGIERRY